MAAKGQSQPQPNSSEQRALRESASRLIDERIATLGDWRGDTLSQVRRIILAANPEIVEEWKWMGTPVWSHSGNLCTGETYKQVVKLTFARGAFLDDPKKLFNSSLEGNLRRAIDIREGETIDTKALTGLVQAAIAENLRSRSPKGKAKAEAPAAKPKRSAKKTDLVKGKTAKSDMKPTNSKTTVAKPKSANRDKAPVQDKAEKKNTVVLLSGGNPQIAKGDGDAPVQAFIDALTGRKADLCKRIDALICRAVPQVRKAVRWNSPFYGVEGQGWFLNYHILTHYVKITFFRGTDLKPIPPGGTEKSKESRWIDLRETDKLDETQLTKWFKQAAAIPGWKF